MQKAKILVLGPCESGKTVLSNFLADATETSGGEYHPTQGVRILEFEGNAVGSGSRPKPVEVELWDCSGDRKFESCWPSMARDAIGVMFVFNPDEANHDKELDTWMNYFLSVAGIKASNTVCFAHHKPSAPDRIKCKGPASFSKMKTVHTNIEEDAEGVRQEFYRFLGTLVTAMTDKQEEEELNIMNSR
ncbi:intraflagellar transport protein 22 homolog isoform X2 [Haliotis rubra]|uniref:intraflagellar transport protein 22 homolog isoform X2 n=1 Tax=Haliotis rubra TaxID=36100 RepID=UPI001EE559DF|nr:intraflagellar transport protein 22 homolog isoform X2 [Haliotis rubra]